MAAKKKSSNKPRMSDTEVARALGMPVAEYRRRVHDYAERLRGPKKPAKKAKSSWKTMSAKEARHVGAVLKAKGKPFEAKKRQRRTGAEASKVQSLLFSKTKHARGKKRWTETTAKAWAKKHGYRYGDVEAPAKYIRLRQFEPDSAKWDYRTIAFGESGIKAVIAFPKRAALRLPPRLRVIEGGAPAHVLREVEEQMLGLRRRAA